MSTTNENAGEQRPVGPYALLCAVFAAWFGGGLLVLLRRGRILPQPQIADVVMMGAATQRLSRLVTRDKVTSFVRAPFVHYEGPAGRGEVSEEPRGTGLRHAVGELLVCPLCIAQWIVGIFTLGLVAAPRLTRLLAAMWAAEAVADGLQLAHVAGRKRA